jgi:hypothetical protein
MISAEVNGALFKCQSEKTGSSGKRLPETGTRILAAPFDAAEQQSWWRNKAPNLSERQQVFGVPPLASSTGEPAGPASLGVFSSILLLDKQKEYAKRRAKAI